jgi:crotonobetainyl-CoA:carnitine CoA-transferase CaiB-like acyl-CoA transferase
MNANVSDVPAGILSGVRIVDLSNGIAGSVATLMLAEAGADVVKIEPPQGSSDRGLAGFRTWNRSKRSVIADVTTAEGRAVVESLLANADICVHNFGPTESARLGLDDATLQKRFPHLITSAILGWPINHRNADRPVDELLVQAELGVCDEQMPIDRDGPVYVRAPIGNWAASYLAAVGIVARLLHRRESGVGGAAHTSLAQGVLVPMGMHWSRAEHPSDGQRVGMVKEGRGSQWTMFECADGLWLHVMPPGPDVTPLMQSCLAAMDARQIAEANATVGAGGLMMARTFPNLGANQIAFKQHGREVWLTELWAHDVPAQPCSEFGEVLLDEQARVNGYTVEVDDPEVGRITMAGLPLTITPPSRVASPAPMLGAHTNDVLAEWAESSLATQRLGVREQPMPSRGSPLAGMKVLDLGNFLAGPYACQVFSDLGADVVKLEAATGDPMRPGDWAFSGCQRGKRSLALNLKSPDATPVLRRAIAWADIVHHNLRLPAATRLGLDPAAMQTVNTNAIVCHTSSYGPIGPRKDWPGYDQMFQARCGWEVFGSGDGNIPMWLRFGFMDHLCALSSVLSTLLACYLKATTGVVTEVRGSLLGPGAFTNSETYVRADGTFAPCATLDREQLSVSIGRRIAQTSDGWIAIAADTESEVAALLGATSAVTAKDLVTSIGTHTTETMLDLLREVGITAGELRREQKAGFFDNEDHRAAGMIATYPHAEWGILEQPGDLWYFGDLSLVHKLAPPTLGQHTREVLREFGVDEAEIGALLKNGTAVAYETTASP